MGRPSVLHLLLALLVASCNVLLVLGKDYYELLHVPRGASEDQIKRSYRKLALKYHPDKVTGTEEEKKAAADMFSKISNAYEALSDESKRKVYDKHGEEGLKQQQQQGGRGGGNADFFSSFFGGGFGGQQEETTPKGHDVYADLIVTLKDLYLGKEMRITRVKSVIKPAPGTRDCKCRMKLVTKQLGPGMYQQFQQQQCEKCPNVKLEMESEMLTVHVEPGMAPGQIIDFFEEGEPMVDGEPGDLKLMVRSAYEPKWERRANDLILNQTISLVDALTGFERQIEHLDGHLVTIGRSTVTHVGDYQFIEGEGMPVFNHATARGNLYIQYFIEFPKVLTEHQKEVVRQTFATA
ncbi:hypothetical protein FOA52_000272 [Chlamydomonas sp. UWO 241]|nr:hypothetical protein FOA52_000272 [Chlamydomonas sp. UWO 241]